VTAAEEGLCSMELVSYGMAWALSKHVTALQGAHFSNFRGFREVSLRSSVVFEPES